ncbi:lipoprotein [Legionella sp. W10-070]|uniref:LPS translocon maturation chaperone LptM n=1 Tax=unclassified Legionella TaxID=2622702 RepID=UPI0032420D76
MSIIHDLLLPYCSFYFSDMAVWIGIPYTCLFNALTLRKGSFCINAKCLVVKLMRLLLTVTLIAVSLTACGQKGPLYLPDRPQPSTSNSHQVYK